MSKKSIEDRFSIEIDAYFNGIERQDKLKSEEYNELLELGKILADKDFSENSNKEKVFNKTLENINKYRGEDTMKKTRKVKNPIIKVASFALVCILGFSIMQTSFAQEAVGKVLKTISLGHITIFEDEIIEKETIPVPEQFKGKVFDKDGNPLEVFLIDEPEKIYTADGEEIDYFDPETGEIITAGEAEKMIEGQNLIVKEPNKLNDYTCFNVILPSYLPEGYQFDKAEFYKGEDEVVENSKYISLFFTNEKTGKFIYMQQRFADEETGYEAGGSKVEEIKINGVDAVIYDDRNIDWEVNGVIYGISGRGEITKDELIKIAESIK
jgi:hypothetical protein